MMRERLLGFLLLSGACAFAADHELIEWEKRHLDGVFYSEGACHGDFDRDGAVDLLSGPFLWLGPAFEKQVEIFSPKAFDPQGYSDNFFNFPHDFNGDGWLDVLVIGFPGLDSRWYENPGEAGGHWPVHLAMEKTDNESPAFIDLTGDGLPEIVCSVDGTLGYATPNPEHPEAPFTWHALSPENAVGGRFTHGLGVGDVNGDGRLDVLEKERWWEQPESLEGDPVWKSHRFALGNPGGAQMYVYDFDGDGDGDILTSLAAHAYGLAWFEQTGEGTDRSLEQYLITGKDPLENKYGLAFSQMHAIAMADIDGDGVEDVVTGKRYWAHGGKDPGGKDPAVLYWFRTVRNPEGKGGVDFVPYQIDDDSGVGTEVKTGDLNGDGLLDIVVGNKKGTFIHFQKRRKGDRQEWIDAQPMPLFMEGLQPMDGYAAGRPAGEAASSMTLPEGFTATLLAAEPEVRQPITFCFDARGRLWVAEAYDYPFPKPGGGGKDRILIFEDEDGDGTFETRKVFIEGISLISGLEVGFGGAWVGAAPNFLFIPDRDGDDVPDGDPEVLLDGWGTQDTHETLNSFSWGPDGWLYGLHGVFTHSNVGKPGTPEDERTFLNCAVWRYHPVRHDFDIFSTGTSNPWGLDFDVHGQAFISACVIPHLWHMIQGAYYERQGGQHQRRHLYELIGTIARHRHYAGSVADHAHWGHTPREDIIVGDTFAAGGGHAHCGLTIYAGDGFPERYQGALLMFNLHGHRINWDRVRRQGAGYVGDRAPDFLFSNDHWFIGTHLDYGPDGALYFSDWQDDTTCHRQNDLEWDRSNGRLFRVHHGEHRPVKVNLAAASDLQLANYQKHENEWFARVSRRLLQERRAAGREVAPQAAARLWRWVRSDDGEVSVPVRLRALWTLHTLGEAASGLEKLAAKDESEYVRAWAVRLLGESGTALEPAVAERLAGRAREDGSPFVRRHLASLLQRIPADQAWPIAEALAGHGEDAEDAVLPLLLWYGLEPLVASNPARGLAVARDTPIAKLRQFIIRRVAAIPGGYETALAQVEDAETAEVVVAALAAQLKDEARVPMPDSWQKVYALLRESDDVEVRTHLLTLAGKFGDKERLPEFRELVRDAEQPEALRLAALRTLVDARDSQAVPVLHEMLRDADEPAIRERLIGALATVNNATTPGVLLDVYQGLSSREKQATMRVLTARADFAGALLEAVGEGRVPRGDVSVVTARQILQFKESALTELLERHWGSISSGSEDKAAEITKWREKLTPEVLGAANLSNGRRVYNETCYVCHTLFGQGVALGPDITGANRSDLDYLLENIVDPNSLVPLDYQMVVFTLRDESVVAGMIRQEGDTAFTVALPGGVETTVAKADVVKRESLAQSLMPEGMLTALSETDARDLIAYLQSDRQVRLPQEGELIVEGETMEVVEKTGNAAPQGMGSFLADEWSGDAQLWWTGGRPGDQLILEFEVPKEGKYALVAVMTKAVDYGKVRLALDRETRFLTEEIDLFESGKVITTGERVLGAHELSEGPHRLIVNILGKNPRAVGHMFGLDYLQLVPAP